MSESREQLEDLLKNSSFDPNHRALANLSRYTSLMDNNVFKRAIIVNINPKGMSFIPTVVYSRLFLSQIFDLDKETSVICDLPCTKRAEKKAALTILKALFNSNDRRGLLEVNTGKDWDYIGGTGLIMDSSWNPMMMTGFDIEEFEGAKHGKVHPVVYVDPTVFTRKDLISRAIVGKLIPWYSTHFVNTSIEVHYSSCIQESISIRVEDFSHMFITPLAPDSVADPAKDCFKGVSWPKLEP